MASSLEHLQVCQCPKYLRFLAPPGRRQLVVPWSWSEDPRMCWASCSSLRAGSSPPSLHCRPSAASYAPMLPPIVPEKYVDVINVRRRVRVKSNDVIVKDNWGKYLQGNSLNFCVHDCGRAIGGLGAKEALDVIHPHGWQLCQ